MIIFTLDALADDSHRRHLIDRQGWCDHWYQMPNQPVQMCLDCQMKFKDWKPDYEAYNAACGDDKPIDPVISIWNKEISLGSMGMNQIWTGRHESFRDQTLGWLKKNLLCFEPNQLKMASYSQGQEHIFDRWLDKHLEYELEEMPIEMVFSSHKPSIEIFRKRGVFVFDCNQADS